MTLLLSAALVASVLANLFFIVKQRIEIVKLENEDKWPIFSIEELEEMEERALRG